MVCLNKNNILGELMHYQEKKFSGSLRFNILSTEQTICRSHIIKFEDGYITYGAWPHQTPESLFYRLGRYLDIKNMRPAIQLANKRAGRSCSVREYLDLCLKLQLLTLEDFEEFTYLSIIWPLEQVLHYSTEVEMLELNSSITECCINNLFEFRCSQIEFTLKLRQQEWFALKPLILSLETVPQTLHPPQDFRIYNLDQYQLMDGQRSLFKIANVLEKDPLEVAKIFYQGAIQGWVTFEVPNQINLGQTLPPVVQHKSPIVLSVDDSPIVQETLKRMLLETYSVKQAYDAFEALEILRTNKISLILLDVTMPDIDGLMFSRTIRRISEFKNIPIIMLTAKDSVIDRLKGQMAGANEYLSKPVNQEKLLTTLNKYLD